jgi:Cu-Zn family superoxide dismutase
MKRSALFVAIALSAAACSQGGSGIASAHLESRSGTQVTGDATFTQTDGTVNVTLTAKALPPGKHGVYIHDVGDCTGSNAAAVGPRFAPGGDKRGGVLGELDSTGDGSTTLTMGAEAFTVKAGDRSVVGRSIVISSDPDNPALDQTFGIIACGVIHEGTES